MELNEREVLKSLFDLISDYRDGRFDQGKKTINLIPPGELYGILDIPVGKEGSDNAHLLGAIEKYLEYSVRTHSPNFANQLWSGENFPALIGEIVTAAANSSAYTYEAAPAAMLIEKELINKMGRLAGYESPDGTFTTGGSNSNLLSLHVARHTLFPEAKEKGNIGIGKLVAFVSDQSHYSFEKAFALLGLGMEQLVKVATDKEGRILPEDLEKKISESLQRSEKPFYVAATAGTTAMGAFDPLEDIAAVAKKHGLWFHIDGAWGGSLLLSSAHKHLLKGSELSDSFSWDPHKLMGIPLICSVALFRDSSVLLPAVYTGNTSYLFHTHPNAEYDLGRKSLQCGRRIDALKLWLSWKYYGDAGYEKRIDKCMELAQYATQRVNEDSRLEMMAPTVFCNVNFRYRPRRTDLSINEFNKQVRENVKAAGYFLFNYCYIGQDLSIRYITANAEAAPADIDNMLNAFTEEASRLDAE